MPRKKKASVEETARREKEILDTQVRTDGAGEHPVIKAVLSDEFIAASDLDATHIALLLQQILKGQQSLLALYNENVEEITRLKTFMANTDTAMVERMETQKREIEDVLSRAEKLRLTGDKKDRLIAKAGNEFTQAVVDARARKASDMVLFDQKLAAMKQVEVISPGEFIMERVGQSIIPRIIPEVIRIKHRQWILQPNVPTMVPEAVAQTLFARRQGQAETAARQAILSKHMEQGQLSQEWAKIGKADSMPLAPS